MPSLKIYLFYLAVMGLSWSITILAVGAPLRWIVDLLTKKKPSPGSATTAPDDEKHPHPLKIFFSCPACVGFWVAYIMSALLYSPALDCGLTRVIILASVLDGLVAVALNWVMHVVLTRLGQYDL